MAPACSRLRGRDLTVRMKCALTAHRSNNDRGFPFHTKDFRRCIDTVDIDEPARPDLKPRESGVIRTKRNVVINSGCHVCPMRRRKLLTRKRLEIENVNGLLGRRQELLNWSLRTRSG